MSFEFECILKNWPDKYELSKSLVKCLFSKVIQTFGMLEEGILN